MAGAHRRVPGQWWYHRTHIGIEIVETQHASSAVLRGCTRGKWPANGTRMKESFYIFRSGALRKKEGSLYYAYKSEDAPPEGELFSKKAGVHIPVARVRDLFIFGQTEFNTQALGLLSKHSINCHFFN
jgi:hypothetical protein